LHVALAFDGTGHGVQLVPHVAGALVLAHAPEHAWYPPLHAIPHVLLVQLALPFDGAAHALPHAPQFWTDVPSVVSHPFVALLSQFPNPLVQEKPQLVPLQLGAAFVGVGQTVHDGPHAVTDVAV
jgi:hypothetical protein